MGNIETIISNPNKGEINKATRTNDQKKNCNCCNPNLCPMDGNRNHICSVRNEQYKHATELSEHIWSLKDQKIAYQIKWRKIKQARSYSNVTKRCNLCLWEKIFILRRPEMSTLNSRNELTLGCRHARKFLLKNVLFC